MEVLFLYQILFSNVSTQQIVRHTMVKTKAEADQFLTNFEKCREIDEDIIIFDYEKRTFKARYVSHLIYRNSDCTVYKFSFDLKLSEVQAIIKK
jgi:hypothetical protein